MLQATMKTKRAALVVAAVVRFFAASPNSEPRAAGKVGRIGILVLRADEAIH